MIPKIIHYVWMGKKEIPETLRTYMRTWERVMPDWEVMRWDETNFDINTAPRYVREAYAAKKYAFVSDYVRLVALKQMGGVYMDVDVEVIRSFDELPDFIPSRATDVAHQFIKSHASGASIPPAAFIGFEENKMHSVGTCVIGSEKGASWLDEQLTYYQERPFVKADGTCDLTTNAVIMTHILEKHGLVCNGEEQVVSGIHIYDFHHFSPLTSTRVMRANEHTYAVHHYAESWRHVSERRPYRRPIVNEIVNAIVQVKRLFE